MLRWLLFINVVTLEETHKDTHHANTTDAQLLASKPVQLSAQIYQNSLHAWFEQIWTVRKLANTQQYLPLLANISPWVTSHTRPNSFNQSSWGYSVELVCCIAYKCNFWFRPVIFSFKAHLKASWMFSSSDAWFPLLFTAAVTDPWMLRMEKIPKHCKRCKAATWGKVIRIINLGLHMFSPH